MSTIDTTLPAQPTGAAAALAAAHAGPHPLKFYGAWFCPFVQRAWIVLAEKRVPHQYVEVNPYRKEAEFLAVNPRGLVPALVLEAGAEEATTGQEGGSQETGGEKGVQEVASKRRRRRRRALYESTVLCEFLDEAYPGGEFVQPTGREAASAEGEGGCGGRMLPAGDGAEEVFERARCRLWINHIATRVVPGFYRLLQHTPGNKAYTIEEARAEFLGALKAFAKEMLDSVREGKTVGDGGDGDDGDDDGPWFLGKRFSLVDVMLAPWAKRLFLIDHYKPGGVGIPPKGERGEDEEVWARWDRWYDAVVDRESVKATWSDEERYIEAYRRYAEDKTQSEVGQATRQGRSLP